MKSLIIFLLLVFNSSKQLIPDELKDLIGSENNIEKYTKLKTDLYKSYKTLSDAKGVYAIDFELRNPNKLIDYLNENNFEKVYDVDNNYRHLIVFTNKQYQIEIYKKERTARVYNFQKRKFEYVNDDFYGGNKISSLRFGRYQESQFSPSVSIEFIPEERFVKCQIKFTGPNWLYSNKIKFSLNSGDQILTYSLNDISNDVNNGRYDVYITEVSSFLIPIEEADLFLSKDITVRIIGEKYFDFPMTPSQKYAITDMSK